MPSKYEPSPYKNVGMDAKIALDDRDEKKRDKNCKIKRKYNNKTFE